MSDKPSADETLPAYLRNHATRIERLERLPRGNGLPPGATPGQVVGFDENGKAAWITPSPFPPGGDVEQVLGITGHPNEGVTDYGWLGPMWWMWWGTEDQYNALGTWDDRVLYVIVQNVPGAVTTVAADDVAHTP